MLHLDVTVFSTALLDIILSELPGHPCSAKEFYVCSVNEQNRPSPAVLCCGHLDSTCLAVTPFVYTLCVTAVCGNYTHLSHTPNPPITCIMPFIWIAAMSSLTHVYTHTHKQTHTHTHTHTHTQAHSHTHTSALTDTPAHALAHTGGPRRVWALCLRHPTISPRAAKMPT